MTVICVGPLIVDGLTLTAKVVAQELLQTTQDSLDALRKAAKQIFPKGKIVRTAKSQGVHIHLYPEGDRKIADVQAAKTRNGYRYFRLALWPSQFRGSDFEHLQKLLADWLAPFTYESLYEIGRVTRLDLAVDDLLHPLNTYLPFMSFCNVSTVYMNSPGEKGTVYLGSGTSPLQFANYDKRRQLLDTGGKPEHLVHTRFEARIRQGKFSVSQIITHVKNPFRRLGIADIAKAHSLCSSQEWKHFLFECVNSGSCKALAQLHCTSVRKKYLKMLREAAVAWWRPEKFWKGIESALQSLKPSSSIGLEGQISFGGQLVSALDCGDSACT
jgi:hypothetical protein